MGAALALLVAVATMSLSVEAFCRPSSSPATTLKRPIYFCGSSSAASSSSYPTTLHRRSSTTLFPPSSSSTPRPSTTTLHFGQDSGILGVGAPEMAVTLLVGYFVLGPSDLYKLVKEIGKFIQNVRTLGSEAAKSFEGTMENQLELTELRKAQRELNAAFNFRRSINTDESSDAFDINKKTGKFGENSSNDDYYANDDATTAIMTEGEMAMSASGMVGGEILPSTTTKKRKLVRRKKKRIVEIKEQEVEEEEARGWDDDTTYPDLDDVVPPLVDDLRAERMRRLMSTDDADDDTDTMSEEKSPIPIDWYNMSNEDVASATLLGSNNNNNINNNIDTADEAVEAAAAAAAARFQSQLSIEQWNARMMANNENAAPSPLSMAMQRLALLEDEKNIKDALIEEEYRKRLDNEDEYYSMKRMVIMDAISEIQNDISSSISESSDTTTAATTTTTIGVNGHNNDDDNNKEEDIDDDDDDESSMMSTKEELENWARSTKFSL